MQARSTARRPRAECASKRLPPQARGQDSEVEGTESASKRIARARKERGALAFSTCVRSSRRNRKLVFILILKKKRWEMGKEKNIKHDVHESFDIFDCNARRDVPPER